MIKVYINKDFMCHTADIYIYDEKPNGEIYIAKPITLEFEELDKKYVSGKSPTLVLERDVRDDFLNPFW